MPYQHLTRMERELINRWRVEGLSPAVIAGRLGRHRSTIGRELVRNRHPQKVYWPANAQARCERRRRNAVRRPKQDNRSLMRRVLMGLLRQWSPEQIAGRVCYVEEPLEPAHWISPATIYRYVWRDKARGGGLWRCLRHGLKKKRKRYGSADGGNLGRAPAFAGRKPTLGSTRSVFERQIIWNHRLRFRDSFSAARRASSTRC